MTTAAHVLYILQWVNLVLLAICLAAAATFVAVYARSVWRDSMLGRATMYLWGDMALILALAFATRMIWAVTGQLPDTPATWWSVVLSTLIFLTLAWSLWWKVRVVILIQNESPKVAERDLKYRMRHRMPCGDLVEIVEVHKKDNLGA